MNMYKSENRCDQDDHNLIPTHDHAHKTLQPLETVQLLREIKNVTIYDNFYL